MQVQKTDKKTFKANLIIKVKEGRLSFDEISELKKIAKKIGKKRDEIIVTIRPEARTKRGEESFSKWYGMGIGMSIRPYRVDLGQSTNNPDIELPSPFEILSKWLNEFAKENPSTMEKIKRFIRFSN